MNNLYIIEGILLIISIIVLVIIIFENTRTKNKITPSSVKQALDNMKLGICFADETGRIVLINYVMGRIISEKIGKYPQIIEDIEAVLDDSKYYFENDKVWRFNIVRLSQPGLEKYKQITAEDVTELYKANIELEQNNDKLKKTNEDIKIMLEKLSDRIREKETLDLKMQIHNDIGTSLIEISNIMNGNKKEDMDSQIKVLQNAVSYFSNNYIDDCSKSFLDIIKDAENMGVEVIINKKSFNDKKAEEIINIAIKESVTNCIKHAKGNKLYVELTEKDKVYFVNISNNGKVPDKEITEIGGLLSLRKRLEDVNGKMNIEHEPKFKLILEIPKGAINNV